MVTYSVLTTGTYTCYYIAILILIALVCRTNLVEHYTA